MCKKRKYRDYVESDNQNRVEQTYKNILTKQNLEIVLNLKNKYLKYPNIKLSVWDMMNKLNNIIDESDPDSDVSQIYHAYQTAESLYVRYTNKTIDIKNLFSKYEWENLPDNQREIYEEKKTINNLYSTIKDWSWLPLIGFIHDMGKILVLPEFGKLDQEFVVGDTFPVGCKLHKNYIFSDKNFHKDNIDYGKFNRLGIYKENCGFDNVNFSWGHDEYLAMILDKKNNTDFPKEAIYIIRYHSFYCWHSPKDDFERGYTYLAHDYDWYMLPLLKLFQKSDLYSKNAILPPVKKLEKKYKQLIDRYITTDLNW